MEAKETVLESIYNAIEDHVRRMYCNPHIIFINQSQHEKLKQEAHESYGIYFALSTGGIMIIDGVKIIGANDLKDDEIIFGYSDIERLKKLK